MAEIITAIVGKVAEMLVAPITKYICYPFKCQSNIDVLKKQVEKLTDARDRVLHSVDEAKRQGHEIENDVEKWLSSVDEFTQGVVKPIIDDQDNVGKLCSIGFGPSVVRRYSLSKKAVKTAERGVDLLAEGTFDKVSYRPPLQKTTTIYNRGFDDFDSRKALLDDLMEALMDPDVNLIGVHGMGGVGKTTLVKRVYARAIEEKLFDAVVMAEVTQAPDIKNIQDEIADSLELKFQEVSLVGRAARLRQRLKKEKKVLVILDNLWGKLNLDALGIPLGGHEKGSAQLKEDMKGRKGDLSVGVASGGDDKKGGAQHKEDRKGRKDDVAQCKILLTSRHLNVLCIDMNIEKKFSIDILSYNEAWSLFVNIVGDSVEKPDFNPIAVEVVKKCAGLPVAIATIANALKNRSDLVHWKDALRQLRRPAPGDIEGMDVNVYSTIKLSYDLLRNEEAKSIFLLCGLENAGSNIPIEDLLRYCIGLALFKDVYTLEEGRIKLQNLVDLLKRSCLLLDGTTNTSVKMHEIVHIVAGLIARSDKLMFNIQNVTRLREELEEKIDKESTAISLPEKDIYYELPRRLEFPKLQLFFLSKQIEAPSLQIPDTLFEATKELKVLGLTRICLVSLPSSFCRLTNLQSLCLNECLLGDIAIIGKLKNLKILSFQKSDIEQLPEEITQLTRLRLLDLSKCLKLKIIKPNVISSLTHLEELYMGDSFVQWEREGGSNANLAELKHLSCLKILDIHVLDARIVPQDWLNFEKLERYRIFIGEVWEWSNDYESSRTLKLQSNNSCYFGKEVYNLLNITEDLYLGELKGVKNVLPELNREGFPQLKHLCVQNSSETEYLIKLVGWGPCNVFPRLESLFLHNLMKLQKICDSQLATGSFGKLKIVKVEKCDRMKHLFSFSIAKNLLQLQEIEINDCKELEEIVFKESKEQFQQNDRLSRIVFTQLSTLRLQWLPRLTSFGFKEFMPDTRTQEIVAEDELGEFMPSFSQNVSLPSLENLKLSSIDIECTWLDQLPVMSSCCRTLTSLTLEECSGNLKFLFSYSIVKSLVQLQELEIRDCESIEGIINTEELSGEGKVIKIVFPKLINLRLEGLPNLTQFGYGISVELPFLTQLIIDDCPKLITFSTALTSMNTEQNKKVEEVSYQEDYFYPLFDAKVVLPTLASLNLFSISIETIWHDQLPSMSSCFQTLTKITIDDCNTLKYVFSPSIARSLVKLEVLEISYCMLVEEVIFNAGETMSDTFLPKLNQLHLEQLPELTRFCNLVGNSIELPSLAQLWLENCPKMQTFVSNSPQADMQASKDEKMNSEENLHSHVLPLFDEKVRIPHLKSLRIEKMDNLRKIWYHQLTPDSFSKIDTLEVYDCCHLLNVFPSNMLGRLQKLEELMVSDCDSLEKIFEEHERSSCMVEEMTAKEEDVEAVQTFIFPQLTRLLLTNLPSLTSFYPRLHISEWPKLKTLKIWGSNKVVILTSEILGLQENHKENQLEKSVQESIFVVNKVTFPKLERLALEWNWIEKEMLHGSFQKYSCNLKYLELISFSKQSAICPYDFLCTLPNLERLKVYYSSFEDLFICERDDCKEKHLGALSKLNSLRLIGLEDSSCLREENSLSCKVFQNLTTLEVLSCDNLEHLVPSFVSFKNLTALEVSECNKLENLMVVPVAKSLMQLTQLKITKCEMIGEIINDAQVDEMEDQIVFNRLEYLELHSLPKLSSFYSGNYTIEFPSLQQVIVRQCLDIKIFSQGALSTPRLHKLQVTEAKEEGIWEGDLNTTIQKLFKDMIGFRDCEHLTISHFPRLKEVWHSQFPVDVFCNLEWLVMDECHSSAIPGTLLQQLNSLEKLDVRLSETVEVVFDLEELKADGNLKALSNLTEFCLGDLPRLKHIWKYNYPQLLRFRNLTLMKVDCCSSLRYVFTPSVVLSLVQLQQLEINSCAMMEEIITREGDNDTSTEKITFHQLNCLIVTFLPSLTSFYSGSNTLEFPLLTTIKIIDCPKVETFVFPNMKDTPIYSASLCSDKVLLPSLESLNLSRIGVQSIWHSQLLQERSLCYRNLTKLMMISCDNLKYLSPSVMTESLFHLEVLHIMSCKLMKGVIIIDEERKRSTVFPKLKQLKLNDLPKLTRFSHFNGNSIEFPFLSELEINNCPKMRAFASKYLATNTPTLEELEEVNTEKEKNLHFFFDEKVACPSLEVLELIQLAELLHLWKKDSSATLIVENLTSLKVSSCNNLKTLVPSSVSLPKLKTMTVKSCNELINVITLSTTKTFMQLESMSISWCEKMEEIIIDKGGKEINTGEGVKDAAIEKITLPILNSICLWNLPNLTSFYLGSDTLEFPSLTNVVITNCPRMDTFAFLNMKDISIHNASHFCDQVLLLPIKDSLDVSFDFENIWVCNPFPYGMSTVYRNLTKLKMIACDNLKYLSPSSMTESLYYLEVLHIQGCRFMEGVIIIEEEKKRSTVFPKLKQLKLNDLPELTRFSNFNGNSIELPSLSVLEINNCPKMRTFASTSLSTDMPAMEELEEVNTKKEKSLHYFFDEKVLLPVLESLDLSRIGIQNIWHNQLLQSCKLMEGVIVSEGTKSNILFPKLKQLNLDDLPQLSRLCNLNGNSVELPSLCELKIKTCPKLRIFASDSLFIDMPAIEEVEEVTTEETIYSIFDEKSLSAGRITHNSATLSSSFQNLTKLTFGGFDNLKYLFPISAAENLVRLEDLNVSNCKLMEGVIVSEEYRGSSTPFPKLRMLNLENLPELTRLCNFNVKSIELCSLSKLHIKNCPRMHTFASDSLFADMPATELSGVNAKETFYYEFDQKVDLPTPTSLDQSFVAVETIWHRQLQVFPPLQNLKVLVVNGRDSKYLFLSSEAENLVVLEVLHISNCKLMEVVIITREDKGNSNLFPKLNLLKLDAVPELTRFCNFNGNSMELPSLSVLDIKNCPKLQTFASDSACVDMPATREPEQVNTQKKENNLSFFDDEKVVFPCLTILKLCELPELLHIWKENSQSSRVFENLEWLKVTGCGNLKTLVPSSVSLKKLNTLEVQKCDGLINLVTSSTAKSLEQLKKIKAVDCKMIEEIILDMKDEIKDVIVFNQLTYLKLHHLPSLTSFCMGNSTIEFPYLERLLVIECIKMINFSSGILIVPKLERLLLKEAKNEWLCEMIAGMKGEEDEGCWEGDLNTTLRKLLKDVNVPSTRELRPSLKYKLN